MRKQEQKVWDYLDRVMKGRWDAQRHEDKHSTSVPDVSFAMRGVDGWLELKTIPNWPVNPARPVTIGHLDSGQVNWMEQRGSSGTGRVWMILVVGEDMGKAEWFLVPWHMLRAVYDRTWAAADFRDQCVMIRGWNLINYLPDFLGMPLPPYRPRPKADKLQADKRYAIIKPFS